MVECRKSPSGKHKFVGNKCVWCGAIYGVTQTGVRESYRTEREAEEVVKRWRKQGYTAEISERQPKISKFVVTRSRQKEEKTPEEKRYETEKLPVKPVFKAEPTPTVQEVVKKLREFLADENKAVVDYQEFAKKLDTLKTPEVGAIAATRILRGYELYKWASWFRKFARQEREHADYINDLLKYLPKMKFWPWEGFVKGKVVDLRGKTRRELFDLVTDETNWKNPTKPITVYSWKYADKITEAINYYVGGSERRQNPDQTITITSKGYYHYIGA